MARPSKTGGKTSIAKTRKAGSAKGRSPAKTKRRIASTAARSKRAPVPGPDKELKEAREQQAATAEILKVIANSPDDVQPVFEAIATSAKRLLGGFTAAVFRLSDGAVHLAAFTPTNPVADEALRADFPKPVDAFEPLQLTRPGEPFPIPDTEEIPYAPIREIARLHGFRGMLFVPLMNGGLPIGVISVTRAEPGAFAPHHIQLLQTFADQAVIAIENARLFEEVQAKTADLSEALQQQTATADVLKAISRSAFDLQAVLDALLTSACRLCEADIGTIRYEDGDSYRLAATYGCKPEWIKHFSGYSTKPDQSSVFGQTIIGGRTVHMPDVLANTNFNRPQAQKLIGFRAALGVPLVRDGHTFGVINLFRFAVGSFEPKQIEIVETFADQAVIAIENVRLFNETQEALERQTATADILKVIASSPSDVQPVFDAIAHSAKRLIGGFSTAVHRVIDDIDHLAAFTPTNPESDEVLKAAFPRHRSELPAIISLVENGETVQIADSEAADEQIRKLARARGWRSATYTPLMNQGTFIGFIVCTRRETGMLADHYVQLLRTFADQAVIAIENARLFNETKETLERQTATADILKVIAGSPTDVQPVFDAIAESARRLLTSHTAVVTRVIDDVVHLAASTAETEAPAHAAQGLLPYPLSSDRIHARVARTGQVAVNTDAPNSDLPQEIKEFARTVGWRSMLVVPMLRNEIAIGTIGITRREPGSFDDTTVDLLKTFADQAVIAIENARLFNETKEALARQTATSDVLKVIASSPSNLQPVFDAIAERSKALIGAHSTTVVRYIGGMIELAAFTPVSPDADAALLGLFPRHPTAEHDVVLRGEIARIHDAESELQGNVMLDAARARGWRSRLHVPLKDDTGVIGWISITRKEAGGFADNDVELLQTFADQAVIAIQNVELFEEVQARTRELSQSLDDLRSAQDRLVQTEKLASLGQLTAGIAHEIKNPLNFVNNFSALSVELTDELKEALMQETLTDKGREELDELTRVLKDNLGKVVQHGKRADSIVKNMLLHSREGSGERRSADINALVGESLNLAYHGARAEKAGFNITLEHDLDPEAGAVDLYPQEITRALLNLISNGFYAATRRKVETGDETFEPLLSAGTRNLGKTVEIRIRDNGTGIATEVREKIFNPFFTTKPTGEGTGLGLSMAHDIIVKQHGGRIDVETVPGAFTEFIITLPRDNGAAVGRKPE
jgi:GAF domain-containing protein